MFKSKVVLSLMAGLAILVMVAGCTQTAPQPAPQTAHRFNLIITTTKLATGKVGANYSQTLEATGGVSPYRWSLTDGDLPDGLTKSGAVISGTPTEAGVFDFTIYLADSAGSSRMAGLSINVLSNP